MYQYATTLKDYSDFCLYLLKSKLWKLSLVFLIFEFAFMYIAYGSDFYSSIIFSIIVVLIISIVCIAITKASAKRNFTSNKILQLTQNVKIDRNGIYSESKVAKSNIPFDLVYCLRESKKFIYIFTAESSAMIIPKNILSNNEYEDLKNILKNNLPSSLNGIK